MSGSPEVTGDPVVPSGAGPAATGTQGPGGGPGPAGDALVETARAIMAAHWRSEGYTVPNLDVYPHQWLWDSCFHAVVWVGLGGPGDAERAVRELTAIFDDQRDDGFVPHVQYRHDPQVLADFWGRARSSVLTQPPMYGHALAELHRRGVGVPGTVVDAAWAGLDHLLTRRPRPGGGVGLLHPWESGCDDSLRWDAWCPGGFDPARWYERKGELVRSLVVTPDGSPVANPGFTVASAGFDALVVFNTRELAGVRPEPGTEARAEEVAASLRERFDAEHSTWVDVVEAHDDQACPDPAGRWVTTPSGSVPTLDALLPVLVEDRAAVIEAVLGVAADADAFGAPFGPTGAHRRAPGFDPDRYWRGPAWPPLTYLMVLAARRAGRGELAARWAKALCDGAAMSGFAEYWNPDRGVAGGAVPQSWATLAAVVGG